MRADNDRFIVGTAPVFTGHNPDEVGPTARGHELKNKLASSINF